MNIVLYVQSFLPSLGGRELVVHYLARSLQSLGHRVRVVIPGGFWCYRNIRLGYPVHRWPTLRGRAAKYVMLPQLLLDTTLWGCDVIHAHSTYSSGYIASLLKKVRNVPLVITPHGEDIHVIPEIGFGQRLDPIQRPKIEYALKNADVVTAISGSIKASLLDAGTAPEKIREIPNGVDLERFQKTSGTDVRRWLGLPPDARLLVTVGNYHPRKGHESLLRAMPYILKSEPRARLVIVGRNSGELLPLIDFNGLNGSLLFISGLSLLNHLLLQGTRL